VTLAKQEMARGDKEHSKMHEAAAHDHLKAAFAPAESKEAVGSIARISSHSANTFPDEKQGRSLRYSEDQPRDPDGKFGSGGTDNEVHDHLKAAGYKIAGFKAGASGIHSGWTKEGEPGRILLHEPHSGPTTWEKKDDKGEIVAHGEGKPEVSKRDLSQNYEKRARSWVFQRTRHSNRTL
jgi:hypothetical protein